ncbi:MAG TPA: thiosulfohydrolase SoxB [Burkholderiaceae bacterium]|jgi:sulfur-oxidizing protein SoxB
MDRRELLRVLGAAAAVGFGTTAKAADPYAAPAPFKGPGAVSLLHMTDCHAQLKPIYFREPSVNLGLGEQAGRWPHLVGDALLKAAGLKPGSREAYAFTSLDFTEAARRYGRVGGFAHLATLVKQLRATRPGALLLDGGDTWQGSATSLWTRGQDMVEVCQLLGVDVMTGHWEFTYGQERVKELVDGPLKHAGVEFIAQNIRTQDFGDEVFPGYSWREINGVPVAIIGQAFPYTPIANPRYLVADWSFGIREQELQALIDQLRAKGAQAVVLLSHNGMDVDLKLASRVSGLDAILGGHTHDGVPMGVPVKNRGGSTLVTNAGSNGKFLGVLDLQVKAGRVADLRYQLLPVFANSLAPDTGMNALIDKVRAPFAEKLAEPLAISDGLLYRRGNFNGSWDQLICDALMDVQGAEIAFSPGFRWGTSLLPGDVITRELLMDQTAITYPNATLTEMSGEQIKTVLEDVADNLFNPDPYYQQGGDMVRVGGLQYRCAPKAAMGSRISDMRLNGKLLQADRSYKVAGWASVQEPTAQANGAPRPKPVWELVEQWLKTQHGHVTPRRLNTPGLDGVAGNAGIR